MKTVDEHLAGILEAIEELPPFAQQILDAHGCALCEDVVATFDLPQFDNSAMDGYAVRAEDVVGATEDDPIVLPVVGDVAAGVEKVLAVAPGLALRIMTGAPIPHGADTVVPVEWTDGGVAKVAIYHGAEAGRFIRRRGEDVVVGQHLAGPGTVIDAKQIAVLTASGRDRVRVRPRPRVVVLSTGSELREPGQTLGEGQIYDSNSYTLAAAAKEAGAIVYRVGVVPDDSRKFMDVLEDQLVRADLVVTSGGVSMGAYDIVKQVLGQLGTVEFTTVAMQPGMPQGFGVVGDDRTPIFTLPGNPVGAYVSFQLFVKPALRKMVGLLPYVTPTVSATAVQGWRSSPDKRQFTRVEYSIGPDGAGRVTPVSGPGSHLVGGLSRANALAVVPEDTTAVSPGDTVEVIVIDAAR